MTLATFFEKFDTFADAPDAVATTLAPLPGCVPWTRSNPVVSLVPRSTTGYMLISLRDEFVRPGFVRRRFVHPQFDHPRLVRSSDAGGIPACSRWSSPRMLATPPETRPPFFRTPAGVPAIPA